ncbi:hypothetical protein RM780_15830 [Streptomyces sp. DSM 44917]|uniref:Uncharacterized protein n=1 Tax=Streptomyces boetiae TaxID=3075541 RepID=A0ABU2LA15_9ACTN|nr:hypothetical protein [Streptomyces sp. DSM 44917]MDT0308419.1 hypothetical protein [Streptomyces sp. DSM 44917]
MDPSLSALIVAVVGVTGTLASGLFAHRSALRTKAVELEHAARQSREERVDAERRASLEARRTSYIALNQAMRQFHAALSADRASAAAGEAPGAGREEYRRALRDAYAQAQMIATDAVLVAGGDLVHRLNRIHRLLAAWETSGAPEGGSGAPDGIGERLEESSRLLYEVRQRMRLDLGITELPVERPDGHGES